MKFYVTLCSIFLLLSAAFAAPISSDDEAFSYPAEAFLGFLDLTDENVTIVPYNNGTQSGLLFLNTTVAVEAFESIETEKKKRSAEANPSPWSWITLARGQPLFRRDANAEAEASPSPWSWITLARGQPLFRRDANAEAEASPSPWSWITLARGQPLFRRDANAEAEASPSPWSWITLAKGQPLF